MVAEKAVVILRQNYKMFVYFSVYDFVALVCENFKYGYKIFKPDQQCLQNYSYLYNSTNIQYHEISLITNSLQKFCKSVLSFEVFIEVFKYFTELVSILSRYWI